VVREGGREGGREGRREGGREGRREGGSFSHVGGHCQSLPARHTLVSKQIIALHQVEEFINGRREWNNPLERRVELTDQEARGEIEGVY
jgi:hypothetical protein